MGIKTPPCKVWPAWTEAKYRQFIRSALRAGYNKWPPKYEALALARRPYEGENKRQKWEYQCACCKNWFQQKDVQVDHIISAGSTLAGWDEFIEKLFCATDELQVLCKTCHTEKTNEEKRK